VQSERCKRRAITWVCVLDLRIQLTQAAKTKSVCRVELNCICQIAFGINFEIPSMSINCKVSPVID